MDLLEWAGATKHLKEHKTPVAKDAPFTASQLVSLVLAMGVDL